MHMFTCPGVPCDVLSVAATEITCITGPSPPDSEYYPGNNINISAIVHIHIKILLYLGQLERLMLK